MNKTDLINELALRTNSTKVQAGLCLDAFLDIVSEELVKHETIRLLGFGTFKVVKASSRDVRNLKTKEIMTVPESYRPRFAASKVLVEKVKNSK